MKLKTGCLLFCSLLMALLLIKSARARSSGRPMQRYRHSEKKVNSAKDKNNYASDDFDERWDAKFSQYADGGKLSAQEFDKMMQEMIDFE